MVAAAADRGGEVAAGRPVPPLPHLAGMAGVAAAGAAVATVAARRLRGERTGRPPPPHPRREWGGGRGHPQGCRWLEANSPVEGALAQPPAQRAHGRQAGESHYHRDKERKEKTLRA